MTTISRSAAFRSRRSSCRRPPLRRGDTGHSAARSAVERRPGAVDDQLAGRTSPLDHTPRAPDRAARPCSTQPTGSRSPTTPTQKTLTVLEASPRSVPLDIPESQGRLITVGPDEVAYLLVESPGETNPGRIVAVPTGSNEAGTVHEVVGSTDGLGRCLRRAERRRDRGRRLLRRRRRRRQLPVRRRGRRRARRGPEPATWSWEWPLDGAMVVRDNETGESFEVPQIQAEREGLRSGDLRPLVDGRVVMLVDDGTGATTAWVLDADNGTWASTELGDALVEAIDPAGAVLTRDPSTLAFDLVPLD